MLNCTSSITILITKLVKVQARTVSITRRIDRRYDIQRHGSKPKEDVEDGQQNHTQELRIWKWRQLTNPLKKWQK
jgi:hypothetical protein